MAQAIPAEQNKARFSEAEIAALATVSKEPTRVREALETVNYIANDKDDARVQARRDRLIARAGDQITNALWLDPNIREATDGSYFYASGDEAADRVANELLNHPDIQGQIVDRMSRRASNWAFLADLHEVNMAGQSPTGIYAQSLAWTAPAAQAPAQRPADTIFESRLAEVSLPSAQALRAQAREADTPAAPAGPTGGMGV